MKFRDKFKLASYLILGGFLVKAYRFVFKKRGIIKKNLGEFFKEEKREIKELARGEESARKYCYDAGCLFKDYFIPHDGNDHKPKILQTKSLAIILVGLIMLKAMVTGYLFFIYPNQARMSEQITAEVLRLTNEARMEVGAPLLTLNAVLSASALVKADDMAIKDYFAHHSPDGKKPWDFIDRGQYAYLFVGENLAINFSSAKSVHNALMKSPAHKKNILNGRYQEIGLAVISGMINGKRTNILVELFGSRQSPTLALAAKPDKLAGSTKETAIDNKENETKVLADESAEQEQKAVAAVKSDEPDPPVEIVEQKTDAVKTAPKSEPVEIARILPEALDKKIPPETEDNPVNTLSISDQELVSGSHGAGIISPNQELEHNPNTELKYYNATHNKRIGIAAKAVKSSKYIFTGILILMIISLVINIFIRISVQRRPVIVQTLIVILFIAGLLSVRLHILESIAEKVAVL